MHEKCVAVDHVECIGEQVEFAGIFLGEDHVVDLLVIGVPVGQIDLCGIEVHAVDHPVRADCPGQSHGYLPGAAAQVEYFHSRPEQW